MRANIRRLAWIAIALAVVGLGCVAMGARFGGAIHWWMWALPSLVIVNASVGLRRVLPTQQRLTRWLPWLTLAVAVAIIVAPVFEFTSKFRD